MALTNGPIEHNWRSDVDRATPSRGSLGMNIGLRGLSARMARRHSPRDRQMEATILPASLVYAFAASLIWVETVWTSAHSRPADAFRTHRRRADDDGADVRDDADREFGRMRGCS
jgi:hypothetical protein